jgi:hypothetical protein
MPRDIQTLRAELKPLGMRVQRTDDGEWRVNFQKGTEATAYYTDDYDDALGTGRAMAKEGLRT